MLKPRIQTTGTKKKGYQITSPKQKIERNKTTEQKAKVCTSQVPLETLVPAKLNPKQTILQIFVQPTFENIDKCRPENYVWQMI